MRPRHLLPTLLLLAVLVLAGAKADAQAPDWEPYVDPELGYRIDLPTGLLEPGGEAEGKLLFQEADGPAQLSVYGEANADKESLGEVAAALEQSDWVREVTYRKGGDSWFVISGYYRQDDEAADELIFYVKLMMSPDHSHYAVFAISYPQDDKERFDPIVDRLEASFRPPS